MTAFEISGRTALVTGANRGIGKAIVEALLERGASKVWAGTRRVEALSDLKARYGERLEVLKLDVTREDDIAAAARRATDVALVINNAGVANAIGTPATSVSVVAVRWKFTIGVTHRSISSMATGSCAGSSCRSVRCVGLASSASIPPEITLRVVSLPPTRINRSSLISWSSSNARSLNERRPLGNDCLWRGSDGGHHLWGGR